MSTRPEPSSDLDRLPEFLFTNEADALYGPAVTSLPETLAFEREIAELGDKMILEVMILFDDDAIELDLSEESLSELDVLVSQQWPEPLDDEDVLDAIVANWGAYVGQTIVQGIGGQWTFRKDLEHVSIRFSRTGLEVFPLHKVRKRFQLGPSQALADFYEALIEELCGDQ